MQVSLPYLFVMGIVAAPVGAIFLVVHLWQLRMDLLLLGAVGGISSMLLLQYILTEIDQDFSGWYKPAAFVIALLAGYATAALLATGWQALRGRH